MYAQRGINSGDVKINNRALVLKQLFACGPMPRSEIAATLNLTRATVTTICNDLFAQNLLVEKGEAVEDARAGRKKHLVDINYDALYVLSVNIHTDGTRLALCNLRGKEVDSLLLSSEAPTPPEAFLHQVAQSCIKLLWDNQRMEKDVLGVGVAVLGPVDHIRGVSLNAFNLWSGPVPVKDILEGELRLQVCVESNVCSMMEAQLVYHDYPERNMLAVKWGPGVGSAFVIDGALYKGYHFRSSELGHNMVENSSLRCRCGKTGCLETVVSTRAIYEKKEELARQRPGSALAHLPQAPWPPDKASLETLLAVEDEPFQKYLDGVIHQVATVISNALQILAPDCVLCYGDLFECDVLFERFSKQLQRLNGDVSPNRLRRIPGGSNRDSTGAVAVAVKKLLIETGGQWGPKPRQA